MLLRNRLSGRSPVPPTDHQLRAVLRSEPLEDRTTPASISAAGAGFGSPPVVAVFNPSTGAMVTEFLAFEPNFTGGVSVTTADVNGDGTQDVIVGAGPGGAPRIRVFDGARILAQGTTFDPNAAGSEIADFFPFESTLRGGVNVAGGNFGGIPGAEDIAVGAGVGGAPRVIVFDGAQVARQGASFTGTTAGDRIADFFAFDPRDTGGAIVTAVPVSNGFTNLTISPGPGGFGTPVTVNGLALNQQSLTFRLFDFNSSSFFTSPFVDPRLPNPVTGSQGVGVVGSTVGAVIPAVGTVGPVIGAPGTTTNATALSTALGTGLGPQSTVGNPGLVTNFGSGLSGTTVGSPSLITNATFGQVSNFNAGLVTNSGFGLITNATPTIGTNAGTASFTSTGTTFGSMSTFGTFTNNAFAPFGMM